MSLSAEDRGIALICDRDGIVKRVIRDDLGLASLIPAGAHLDTLADSEVREKVGWFLDELRTKSAAYDWEITVRVDGGLHPLHFAGARLDSGFLVVVARSRNGLAHVNEELMQIGNDQINALRTTAKALASAAGERVEHDNTVYEELTRLNNEMANLQREMAKRNAQLESMNQQKNRLLGMAAHDLRSPLGIILAYAEYLEEEAAAVLSEEQREFVTTIKDTSEFMLRMVTDLLDVSAIEAGQLKLDLRLTSIAELIRHNVTLNRVLASKKDIAIDFDPPAGFPELRCDAGKIEQVLNNLISNAVKFSHRGTRVRVQLTSTESEVTVAVTDQGQGIPEAEQSMLFKPFGKLSTRGTAGETSTGLGLSIVRRMVEGHGGRIWAESTVGVGSIFRFALPMEPVGERAGSSGPA